jgi:hypothetical protein
MEGEFLEQSKEASPLPPGFRGLGQKARSLDWDKRIHFQGGSLTWLARWCWQVTSSPQGCLSRLMSQQLASPRMSVAGEHDGSSMLSFMTQPQLMYYYLHNIWFSFAGCISPWHTGTLRSIRLLSFALVLFLGVVLSPTSSTECF